MKRLRKQAKGLAKLASHQTEGAVEMTLHWGISEEGGGREKPPFIPHFSERSVNSNEPKYQKINLAASQDRTEVCWYMEWH